jgi:hypothetical protein
MYKVTNGGLTYAIWQKYSLAIKPRFSRKVAETQRKHFIQMSNLRGTGFFVTEDTELRHRAHGAAKPQLKMKG